MSKEKLAQCKKTIQIWVKKSVQEVEGIIRTKTKKLEKIQEGAEGFNREEEKALRGEIDVLLEQEELKWKQRAKEEWLKSGDRNTKYFHACATQRRKRNTIDQIHDGGGRLCRTADSIEEAFVNFYGDLFTSASPTNMEACTASITSKVSNSMNNNLLAEFTTVEVKKALDQMAPNKAPGPDGFTAGFYQQNWDTVGSEVCEAALYFFKNASMDGVINSTNIALIPKKKTPVSVTEFRPISLCNVVYKIIAKVLANRLKVVLPSIISPNQSAFLSGRLITDNILAAYETMHSMHTKMWSKVGFMGIKLDMSKAYDRVEWGFLEAVMTKMGFATGWIKLVMECITTVRYSIVVNGRPVGNIIPTRGLRQGDPLSPYLFILCAEALSSMITQAEAKGVITGVPTSPKGPRLSHLFFADDSLLFCKANSVEWRRLTTILEKYETASGQKLNKEKTSLFFSRNTSAARREEITQCSGLKATEKYEKYLGLPTLVGRSRMKAFKGIKDKVWARLNDWKVHFLSQAGKEILIKAVIQAIPTYCMSVFQLPVSLCKELNSLMQRFWWGHKENTSKIHWMKWEKMGMSKSKGGMGFRDLVMFNKALLAKQVWRIVQNPDSLVARIMKCKYFPRSDLFEAKIGSRPSLAWRSMLSARELVHQGAIWRIGNGESVRIWGDSWLPKPSSFSVYSPRLHLPENSLVSELIDRDTKKWNRSLIEQHFLEEERETILNIPLSPLLPRDRLIWRCTKKGEFSVRSAYHLGLDIQTAEKPSSSMKSDDNEVWKVCWNSNVPPAVKTFIWRACHNLLPTRVNLRRRGVCEEASCPICLHEEETIEHVIWECASASDVWSGSSIKMQKCRRSEGDFQQILSEVVKRCDQEGVELFMVTARKIWMRRNKVVFSGEFNPPNTLLLEAEMAQMEFRKATSLTNHLELQAQPRKKRNGCLPPGTLSR
jgi:hypothetical protein